MKKPQISLSLYNADQMMAALTGDDGMDSVDLCKTSGQTPAAMRKCCKKAAETLRALADKFERLGGMDSPAKSSAQESVNSLRLP